MTKTTNEEAYASIAVEVPAPKPTRAELRAKMFAQEQTERKREIVNFLGEDIEFRQPGVAEFLESQSDESGRNFMIRLLIDHAYVPGTEEKVFEDTDYDMLLGLPMSGSFTAAISVIQKLFDLKVEDKVKN